MKITHVVPTLDPSRGGPSRSVRGLARAQTEFAETVQIVAGGQPGEYESDRDNLHLLSGPLLGIPYSVPSRSLYKRLSESIVDSDLVHVHSVWNGVSTCAARLCRRYGKPWVLSPRGMLDQHNMRHRAALKRVYLLGERSNLAAVSAFHFLDETEKAGCGWLPESQNVPSVIQPNGLDLSQLQGQLAELPTGRFRALNPDPSAKHLLFLGRLNAIKGLELQTRLLPLLLDRDFNAHLHLVGPDDGQGDHLRQLAGSLGVADRIHQHGPIYGFERLRWLQEADAVLLTSHYECNSVTAAEAIAVGGVLVATDTCHLDRPRDGGAAIVVNRDEKDLVEALAPLLSSKEMSQQIRQRALSYAKQNLEWSALANQMVQFYRQLTSQGQPCVG